MKEYEPADIIPIEKILEKVSRLHYGGYLHRGEETRIQQRIEVRSGKGIL